MFKIINKIKNIFKKEKLTLAEKLENEITYMENELQKSVPDSISYDINKLHLNIAYLKLSICKEFNNREIK
jgi:hypothetical protein